MMRPFEARGERGMALVVAMLVLLVLSMLALVMMASVSVNRQVAGVDMQRRKALDNADAGVAEALMRIRNRDVGMTLANPRSTAQIYAAAAGSIPVVGADTVAMGTAQPVGSWLTYSSATKNADVLTVNYKTNPARTQIYKYDPATSPKVQLGTATGWPIYQVTSTGIAGNARRTIVTEVVSKPVLANAKGALCADMEVKFTGNAAICGYNHSADTPPPFTGENQRGNAPDCAPWEVGVDLPAVWTTGDINGAGAAGTSSSVANQENQTGFFEGPWSMLGLTQPEFQSFIGAPVASQSNIVGLVHIDNDAVMQNHSAGAAYHGATGEGMLYVDGDLTLNAGFVYTGLVYVEGDLILNGQAWILGGVVVKGETSVKMTGGATILYSSEAINQKLSQYSGQFVTLSWRER